MADQSYNNNNTFTCPAGVIQVLVEVWGSGGGGGGSNNAHGASGGGGGAYAKGTFTVIPTHTYAVTVGVAGAAGNNGNATPGGVGGTSMFNNNVADGDGVLVGANGGGGTSGIGNVTAGGGGAANVTGGITSFKGGAGNTTASTTIGGGGGGAAANSQAGGDALSTATAGTSIAPGGAGGAGGATKVSGTGGSTYGGGGGGAGNSGSGAANRLGGAGALGEVLVTYVGRSVALTGVAMTAGRGTLTALPVNGSVSLTGTSLVVTANTISATTPLGMQSKVGSFTMAAGSNVISGIGFAPEAILLWGDRRTTDAVGSTGTNMPLTILGMGVSSSSMAALFSNDDFSGGDTQAPDGSHVYVLQNFTGTSQGTATLTSLDSNGFTLNFDSAGSNAYIVNYMAIAGTDLTNVAIKSFTSPVATGNQVTTGVGFKPDAMILIGGWLTGTGAGTGGLGFVTSSGAVSTSSNNDGTSAYYQRTDRAYVEVDALATPVIRLEATLTSFDSDGFTLNFSTVSSGAIANPSTMYALCLKGGSYAAGGIASRTTTGTLATTTGFKPVGLLTSSVCAVVSSSMVAGGGIFWEVGGATGPTARSVVLLADRTQGVSALDRTKVFVSYSDATTPTLQAAADLSSFDTNGFTLNFTTADATAREIIYFALGPNTSTPNGSATLAGVGLLASRGIPIPSVSAVLAGVATAVTANTVFGTLVIFDAVGPSAGHGAGEGNSIPATAGSYNFSWTHTIGSDANRVLIVGVNTTSELQSYPPPATPSRYTTSVTFNGVTMTPIPGSQVWGNNNGYGYVQLFGLTQSQLPAAGSYTVTVTVTYTSGTIDSAGATAGSISFAGASGWGTSAQTAYGTGTTATVAVTSAVGEMVVDIVQAGSANEVTTQTLRWKDDSGGAGVIAPWYGAAQSTATGASSVTMQYSINSDYWSISGLRITPPSPGGSATLTGAGLLTSLGTLVPSTKAVLAGVSTSIIGGTLTATNTESATLSNVPLAIATGILSATGNATVSLIGRSLAATANAVTATGTVSASVSLTSIGVAVVANALTTAESATLSGVPLTTGQGTLNGNVTVSMTGSPLVAARGTLTTVTAESAVLTSLGLTATSNTISATSAENAVLVGNTLVAVANTATANVSVPLTGVSIAAAGGILATADSVLITGVGLAITSSTLSATSAENATLTGQSLTVIANALTTTSSISASVSLTGAGLIVSPGVLTTAVYAQTTGNNLVVTGNTIAALGGANATLPAQGLIANTGTVSGAVYGSATLISVGTTLGIATLSSSVSAALISNLIANPSWESGSTGWSGFGTNAHGSITLITGDAANAHSGLNYVSFASNADGSALTLNLAVQTYNCGPNVQVTWGFYAKHTDSTNSSVFVRVTAFKGASSLGSQDLTWYPGAAPTGWTQQSATYTTPPGTTSIQLTSINCYSSFYVDDIWLYIPAGCGVVAGSISATTACPNGQSIAASAGIITTASTETATLIGTGLVATANTLTASATAVSQATLTGAPTNITANSTFGEADAVLVGASLSEALAAIVGSASATLTGQSLAITTNSLTTTTAESATLSSVTMIVVANTLTSTGGANVNLVGQSEVVLQGLLSGLASGALSGVLLSTVANNPAASGNSTVSLGGASLNVSKGTPTGGAGAGIVSVSVNSLTGTLSGTGGASASLSGQILSIGIGAVSATSLEGATVGGDSLITSRGTILGAPGANLTGNSLTATSYNPSATSGTGGVILGAALVLPQGTITPSGDGNVSLVGLVLSTGRGAVSTYTEEDANLLGRSLTIVEGSFSSSVSIALTGQSIVSTSNLLVGGSGAPTVGDSLSLTIHSPSAVGNGNATLVAQPILIGLGAVSSTDLEGATVGGDSLVSSIGVLVGTGGGQASLVGTSFSTTSNTASGAGAALSNEGLSASSNSLSPTGSASVSLIGQPSSISNGAVSTTSLASAVLPSRSLSLGTGSLSANVDATSNLVAAALLVATNNPTTAVRVILTGLALTVATGATTTAGGANASLNGTSLGVQLGILLSSTAEGALLPGTFLTTVNGSISATGDANGVLLGLASKIVPSAISASGAGTSSLTNSTLSIKSNPLSVSTRAWLPSMAAEVVPSSPLGDVETTLVGAGVILTAGDLTLVFNPSVVEAILVGTDLAVDEGTITADGTFPTCPPPPDNTAEGYDGTEGRIREGPSSSTMWNEYTRKIRRRKDRDPFWE